ncbi:TetR/AcrR family transcriptional regulator [Pseudonocardia sp. TRM90224]|uniref:TetR/AcrR family transcriptional regulator n=1 Tax=Pseudonocardia sp. TRM90224 TaxID=2812678 RepID=UPI001E656F92|nr:TetR/AcrR family transcriptional regulator [Pseudonocardia sp. TRM90224]
MQPSRRKLTPKGESTRARIATAAAELMLERGVAGTTLEDVRIVAGVSSSQIYHYFDDKQALVRAVVEVTTEAVVGRHEVFLGALTDLDGLWRWRDFIIEHQRTVECVGGCPIGTLGSELAEIDAPSRVQIAVGFRRWEASIRGCLRTMHERGELAADADPDELALALLAALQGGLLLTQLQRDLTPLRIALDTMIGQIAARTTAVRRPTPTPDRGTAGAG